MKAAVYYQGGPPEVLKYEEVPDPVCGPRDVLIEVHAVSIEGGDVLARAGSPKSDTPYIGGYLASGVIVEIGDQVVDRQVGQRVTTTNQGGSHNQNIRDYLDHQHGFFPWSIDQALQCSGFVLFMGLV